MDGAHDAAVAELVERLEALLADRTGRSVEVREPTRLSGGASRETWAFVATDGGDARAMVLQRERGGGGTTSREMATQAELLAAATDAGVPVPGLVAVDADGVALGAPSIVMDRVAGETIARKILRDDDYATARPLLACQAGAAMAAVHRMDAGAVHGLAEVDQLAQISDLMDALGEPHPAFELGVRWLERNRPTTRSGSVVHGDFRLGNLIVGPEGLRSVLDWELAHLGDPAEDLGWFCVRAWRFGSPLPAGGVGTVEDLLSGYEAAGGDPIPLDDVHWWQAFGTLKWGVICILQAASHLSGATRSVELAAIGRRVAENEEDLLEVIAGPSAYEPMPASTASLDLRSAPHDRPSAAELLDAVGEYLVEVRDGVPGRLGFHARVAANVVATVRRELELGPAQAARHRERLGDLGVDDDSALAVAIRSDAMDDRLDEVTQTVRASVRDKLAVSNPGYWVRPT